MYNIEWFQVGDSRLVHTTSFEPDVVCMTSSGWAITTGRLLDPKMGNSIYVSFPRTQRRATASEVESRFRYAAAGQSMKDVRRNFPHIDHFFKSAKRWHTSTPFGLSLIDNHAISWQGCPSH